MKTQSLQVSVLMQPQSWSVAFNSFRAILSSDAFSQHSCDPSSAKQDWLLVPATVHSNTLHARRLRRRQAQQCSAPGDDDEPEEEYTTYCTLPLHDPDDPASEQRTRQTTRHAAPSLETG